MKKYLNQIIFITGLIIFISNFIIGLFRYTIVGIFLILFSFLNFQSHKTRLVLPKAFLLSTMFWIIRFSLISISTVLNFYEYLPTKFIIFLILTLFFIKNFPHHPLKLYKLHVLVIFLATNFLLDLMIVFRFDSTFFIQPFSYITLFPIILIQILPSGVKIPLSIQAHKYLC